VDGEKRESIGSDYSLTVNGSHHSKQGKNQLIEAGSEIHHKAGMKIVIEAGAEITLKAGGSFIKVDPSGVTVSGPMVKMNSGGGPGSGTAAAADAPVVPNTSDETPESAESVRLAETDNREVAGPSSSSAQALRAAASKDVALLKQCGRQADGSCALASCSCEEEIA
jgi:type VI secretion system secreted protein VgrG